MYVHYLCDQFVKMKRFVQDIGLTMNPFAERHYWTFQNFCAVLHPFNIARWFRSQSLSHLSHLVNLRFDLLNDFEHCLLTDTITLVFSCNWPCSAANWDASSTDSPISRNESNHFSPAPCNQSFSCRTPVKCCSIRLSAIDRCPWTSNASGERLLSRFCKQFHLKKKLWDYRSQN